MEREMKTQKIKQENLREGEVTRYYQIRQVVMETAPEERGFRASLWEGENWKQ